MNLSLCMRPAGWSIHTGSMALAAAANKTDSREHHHAESDIKQACRDGAQIEQTY